MSAPVAPTPVPAAPTAPATPAPAAAPTPAPAPELRSVADVLASLATTTVPEVTASDEPVVLFQPPKPEGQPSGAAPEGAAPAPAPTATDLEEVPGDQPPTDGAPTDPTAAPDEGQPTDDAPPPEIVAADGTRFRVKGPDGKYTALPEGLGHIEFTLESEDGKAKTYVKSPAELVRMAQQSVSANRTAERTRQEAERLQQEAQEVQQLNTSFLDLMREVFADESGQTWQQRRQEFLQMTSAEARASRAESELQALRQREAQQVAQQRDLQWYAEVIEPAAQRAFTGAPDVPVEAKIGKLNLLTNHLLVNGVVPPEKRAEFAAIVTGPFLEWTEQEQVRMAALTATARQKEQEAAAAQRRAQAAVNQASRAMTPAGRAAPDVPVRAKPKNVNEAMDFVARRGAFAG